ncbi:hypothetical protein [Streptomyces sp. NPDC101150]|uniref:hypothetical protein n=1 Tax=Streptomyces sp. NPDC101150 TaxID=3366114 RepID=UPI0037FE5CAF
MRSLAANDRDLRLVNLLKTQHVLLNHCDTSEAAVLHCTAVADRITGAFHSAEPLVEHVLIPGCRPFDESAGRSALDNITRTVVPSFPQVVASADDSAP